MSSYDNTNNPVTVSLWKLVRLPAIVVITMFVLQAIVQPFFMTAIPAGSVGVLAFGGNVGNDVLEPGPHFKPFWKSTIVMKMWTVAEPRETAPTDSNNQAITATVVPQIWIKPSGCSFAGAQLR